jgi:tRNA nucleotidyltransferase (CCA-adding enzyme)
VKEFLALYRDELKLIEMRSVNPEEIRRLIIVDNQHRQRLGKTQHWLELPGITIEVYDHHLESTGDIEAHYKQIEAVGATTTIIVEMLREQSITLTPVEATVMGLGIHADTGSLTYQGTTARDAQALAYLMTQGAKVDTIARYAQPRLSLELQELLKQCLDNLNIETVQGYQVASVLLTTDEFIPGLSAVAERLIDLGNTAALLLAHTYPKGNRNRLTVIGRVRTTFFNLARLFAPYGGGGHSQAASVNFRDVEPEKVLSQLLRELKEQIPPVTTAKDIMSSPVRTIRPETTIEQAQRILLRYGHSGLSVVDEFDRLVGIISRRDLDLALHHGLGHAPVKGYMTRNLKTIIPETSIDEIQRLMITYDLGRLPVLQSGQLVGIVTRTDILRQWGQEREGAKGIEPLISCLLPSLSQRLGPPLWELLEVVTEIASSSGWHVYLVGGAVRDLLLVEDSENLLLQDIDLVVDGFDRAADVDAGVQLATRLKTLYPSARLEVHGEFRTAALLWHDDPNFGNLWVDIATARTEFYPYPAANPEVSVSSIRQDLYRRDFTINALALRLTSPKKGELLDFFGGVFDLRDRSLRVLHANSFIEDPTRIYRAVRFAVRLHFKIEPMTVSYIHNAIDSGVYQRFRLSSQPIPALTTRLRVELKAILAADYWLEAIDLLNSLSALRCLHEDLTLDRSLRWQLRYLSRWIACLKPSCPPWLLRLELLITAVTPQNQITIALNLHLFKDSIERLSGLAQAVERLELVLPLTTRVSEKVFILRSYKTPTLILIAAQTNRLVRRCIWEYLTRWSKVKPFLDGEDLKALGYKPGPAYKEILTALLATTLDGGVNDRASALAWLRKRQETG